MTRLAQALAFLLCLCVALALFFHHQLASGLDLLPGDRTDGIIEIAILQHWTNVLQGLETWNTTTYFYPYVGTLGYNDAYLLNGLIYSAFRMVGADPFLAAILVLMTLKMIGFTGFSALMRAQWRCRWRWSLLGAMLFVIANNSFLQAVHGQLFLVNLAPLFTLLGLKALRALEKGRRPVAAALGLTAIAVFALWISTAYYTAWFFALFVLIAAVVRLMTDPRTFLVQSRAALRGNIVLLLILAATSILLLLPFLSVYLPKARETGAHAYATAQFYTPTAITFINVGRDNLVWGMPFDYLTRLLPPNADINGEQQVGLPLGLWACFFIAFWWYGRNRHLPEAGSARVLGIATLAALILSLRLTPEHSLWELVYHLVPGASGLRVVARFLIVLVFPICIVVTLFLDRRFPDHQGWAGWTLAAFLILEQINLGPRTDMSRREQLATFAAVPPIPKQCAIIAVRKARMVDRIYAYNPVINELYPHNVDAMYLAATQHRPTINGFSSFNPPDWDFAKAEKPDYPARITTYLSHHNVKNACLLDISQRPAWRPIGRQLR